jgi:hypothetical protein
MTIFPRKSTMMRRKKKLLRPAVSLAKTMRIAATVAAVAVVVVAEGATAAKTARRTCLRRKEPSRRTARFLKQVKFRILMVRPTMASGHVHVAGVEAAVGAADAAALRASRQ